MQISITNNRIIQASQAIQVSQTKKSYNMSSFTKRGGKLASTAGQNYEEEIHALLKNTLYLKSDTEKFHFNSQKVGELGCHNAATLHDITCNSSAANSKDVGIEVKKANARDWVHCHLKYDTATKKIVCPNDTPVRMIFCELFEQLQKKFVLFGGKVPTFLVTGSKPTRVEWEAEKKHFRPVTIDIPDDIIARVYACKGCSYIQVSGTGLFHTGFEKCDFGAGVPFFKCKQSMTIYIKDHGSGHDKTKMNLSVSAAIHPTTLPDLLSVKSMFSLDKPSKFPNKLHYMSAPISIPSVSKSVKTIVSAPVCKKPVMTKEEVIAMLQEKVREIMVAKSLH